MLRDEAVSQVRLVLGFRGDDKNTDIINQLVYFQKELENSLELPYFLREIEQTATWTAEQREQDWPEGFLKEYDGGSSLGKGKKGALGYQETLPNGLVRVKFLQKGDDAYLRENTPEGFAPPVAYALLNDEKYMLYPAPDQNYQIYLTYYKADESLLANNIENKWLKYVPHLLIGLAGFTIASGLRDKAAMETFSAMAQEGRNRLIGFTESRDGAARKYVVGGPD